MTEQITALLAQYNKHNARGSLLAANQTMATIVEALAALLDRPYQCACGKPIQPVAKSEPELKPEPVVEPEEPSMVHAVDDLSIPTPPVKRGPGRPRKHPLPTEPHTG